MSRPNNLTRILDEVNDSLDAVSASQTVTISQMEKTSRLMRSISEKKPLSSSIAERIHLLAELLLGAIAALPHILLRGMALFIIAWIFCLIQHAIQQL